MEKSGTEIEVIQTNSTPGFRFKNGILEIEGKIISLQITEFFQPLFKYLKKWSNSGESIRLVIFNLRYINSTGKRVIIELCRGLKTFSDKGVLKEIIWKHEREDEFMKEFGEDLAQITKIPFKFVEL